MPRASEIKRAAVIEIDGQLLIVREIDVQSPSARGAATLYKMRCSNVQTKLKHQQTFKGDDMVKTVDLTRHKVNYSYLDGDEHVFMDAEDFSEYRFATEDIAEELPFITEDIQGCQVLTVDDMPIGIELPSTVEMTIIDTPPPMKGASATSRSKPATFVTGLVVQVPDYIESGVRVRIHTGERRYTGRVE